MRERILVIEDDLLILDGICRNLSYEGYEVISATDGESGLKKAAECSPDLIILDIMLPKLDGFHLCKALKRTGSDVPILMLTARTSEDDRVKGLKIGADDYVTKPFSLRELMARVEALLRRKRRYEQKFERLKIGDAEVDFDALTIKKGKRIYKLSAREAKLLRFLVQNANRALDRNTILNNVWGYNYSGTARTIDNFITRLRGKIEDDSENPKYIETVFGIGYRLLLPSE
jgi:DNA-binding response OmpR family regulator